MSKRFSFFFNKIELHPAVFAASMSVFESPIIQLLFRSMFKSDAAFNNKPGLGFLQAQHSSGV